MRKSKFDVPAASEIEEWQAAMLNVWLTMRQCEIETFQRLENLVNGDISEFESNDIEEAIRAMTYIVISSRALHACELSLNELPEMKDEIEYDFKDRHERLRTALFVYICILNSKLPGRSDFWELFRQQMPIDQIKVEFRNCLDNIDRISLGFESGASIYPADTQKLRAYSEILEELDPLNNVLALKNRDELEDDQEFFDAEFRQSIADGSVLKNRSTIDFYITGGLLDAMSNRETTDLSIMTFYPLPSINWINSFTTVRVQDTQQINEDSFSRLVMSNLIIHRVNLVHQSRIIQDRLAHRGLDLHELLGMALLRIENLTSDLNLFGIRKERIQDLISDLREGYRWSALIDTVHSEEILLIQGNSIPSCSIGTPLQRFAVPQIVSDGTDDDFQRLKQLLQTSFSWVQATCAKLDGFITLFIRAQTLMAHGDLMGAQDIGQQLQDLTTACFGDRDHVRDKIYYFFDKYHELLQPSMALASATSPSDEEILHYASKYEILPRRSNGASPPSTRDSETQELEQSSRSELGVSFEDDWNVIGVIIGYVIFKEYGNNGRRHAQQSSGASSMT